MRMGIGAGGATIEQAVASVKQAAEDGFATVWFANIFGIDAMTAIAAAGREVTGIELGTAVVPTYSRHPYYMAQQAMTTQAATGGRFVLGIGLSHQIVIETILGLSFEKPAKHMEEYLGVLLPVLETGTTTFSGEVYRVNTTFAGLERMGTEPPSVMIAALGKVMLGLAGRLTDGTITWMTGVSTIDSHIVPTITKAAAGAGRPAPRVVTAVPVCVTSDIDRARDAASTTFQIYGTLPSYRAMLDKEGAAGPADVAIIGDESAVRAGIQRYADAGATDFDAALFGEREEMEETRALLKSLS
jgi:F420-dependent oxidoreductase-like protein